MSGFENGASARPRVIDLNADLGEGFPNDRALLEWVTSASVCCGAHAGGPEVIGQTLRDARDRGVSVGAHPGYPDRDGFGRREQAVPTGTVRDLLTEQLAVLEAMAAEVGVPVRASYASMRLRISATALPPVLGTGIP